MGELEGYYPWGNVGIKQFETGGNHTVFLLENGEVWSVGYNIHGHLSDGTMEHKSLPVKALTPWGDEEVAFINVGYNHTVYVLENGEIWAAGRNVYGTLGNGTSEEKGIPVKVKNPWGNKKVVQVDSGSYHTLFLLENGEVWGTGYNNRGQLGDGTTANKFTPVKVKNPWGNKKVVEIIAGYDTSFFILETGEIYAVGDNRYGQLAGGTTSRKTTPVKINQPWGSKKVKQIGAGQHTVFLLEDCEIWVVGRNNSGELGIGNETDISIPVKMNQPWRQNNISSISVGTNYTTFLLKNGEVWSVGKNIRGGLGDGTTTNKSTPVKVKTPWGDKKVSQVSAGMQFNYNHTTFLLENGEIWSVGENLYGQLGIGVSGDYYTTPVELHKEYEGYVTRPEIDTRTYDEYFKYNISIRYRQ